MADELVDALEADRPVDDGSDYAAGQMAGYAHAEQIARGVLAALPHLPQHVTPSVEEVRAAVAVVLCNAANFPANVQALLLGQDMGSLIDKTAEAVLALLSSQPTVEDVRREALLSAADALDAETVLWVNDLPHRAHWRHIYTAWLRARAAEAGGDHA